MAALDLDDIQGIVARGYGNLRAARYLLLGFDDAGGAGAWLSALAGAVTAASVRPEDTAVNVALTAHGLTRLGLPADILAMFAPEFVEGMVEEHRGRLLGDTGESAPEGWRWGGPATPAVDAVLMLYGAGEAELARLAATHTDALMRSGVRVLDALDTEDLGNREHFGFNDGISQPVIEGLGRSGRPEDTVPAGEFLLGYKNQYGQYTDRPLLPRTSDPRGMLPGDGTRLRRADLGRNGSYLVFRQLRQDVRGFWRFVDSATRRADGTSDPEARMRLAAKIVGRWPSGAPLVHAPDRDDPSLASFNDFTYRYADPHGFACPIGAHVRRTNPRDALDHDPGSDENVVARMLSSTVTSLQNLGGQHPVDTSKLHRLLRRGRGYGPSLATEAPWAGGPDGEAEPERGLYFICLNANFGRQFEFVQGTWVNNPSFDGLYDDADPLVGSHGRAGRGFTVQARPVRERHTGLPRFVTTRGGAYCFLPGIRALRFLGGLGA